MGLEVADRIDELNAAWPLGTDPKNEGDDHLRIIKASVQGSFPGIGNGQVAATAEELDLAITSMQTDVSVANDLADMDMATTPPILDDRMRFDGINWVPAAATAAKLEGTAQYTGYSSTVGSQIVFTTTVSDTVPAGLAVIVNAVAATGWILTATVDLELHLNLENTAGMTYSGGSGKESALRSEVGITRDPISTAFFSDEGHARWDAFISNNINNDGFSDTRSATCIITVAADEVINLCTARETAGASFAWDTRDFNCTLSVREI